jgi:hypothetical protein
MQNWSKQGLIDYGLRSLERLIQGASEQQIVKEQNLHSQF